MNAAKAIDTSDHYEIAFKYYEESTIDCIWARKPQESTFKVAFERTTSNMANKQGKMQNLINYRMRVTLNDGRQMTGQMLAFDKVRSISPPPILF
jgi:hypothetical protein